MGECAAYAVFAESRLLYPQLAYYFESGGGYIAVALKLNYGNAVEAVASIAFEVVETEVEVDGKSLGLAEIHKRDAAEPVFYNRGNLVDCVPGVLCKEGGDLLPVGLKIVVVAHQNAFFLCAPVVVLVLYLEESVVGVEVCAHTNLLPHLAPTVVHTVHFVIVGVEISCVIACQPLVVLFLNIILSLHLEQECVQLLERCYKFCIRSIHQLYARHLFECNRRQLCGSFCNFVYHGVCVSNANILTNERENTK